MKKAIKYIVIGFIVIVLIALIGFKRRQWIRDKVNPNSISLIIDNNLNVNDFTVLWGADYNTRKVIFKNNKDLKKKFKEYGNNYFYISYQDSIIAKFHQFKYSNWHGHDYVFQITKDNDFIVVDWIVRGPDSDKTDKLFPKPTEKDSVVIEKQDSIESDDCIFDQITQTDEFLEDITELKGYQWNKESKIATFRLDNGDTLLITRGGCYHFGVSAEFRLRNATIDFSDWTNVYDKVLWIAKILDTEFEHDMIKNELDSNLITTQKFEHGESVYFSSQYLQDNNYSIDRELHKGLIILRLNKYIN